MIKQFVTLFPYYEDFHFFKDPGQIPYRMQKFGYKVKLVSFNNSKDYFYTNQYLKQEFLNSKKSRTRRSYYIFKYLYKNSRNIDILNLYHITWLTLLYSFIYKIFKREGVVYLKLDNNCFFSKYEWQVLLEERISIIKFKKKLKQKLFKYFLSKVELFSVEDGESCKTYAKYNQLKNKIIVSYNGHTCDILGPNKIKIFSEKENILLTVSRLGTYPKNTELLLESFSEIAHRIPEWSLHLAGKINDRLAIFLVNYFKKYEYLKERIIFHGQLDRKDLFELYNRSKIFVLPSEYEGFANVFSEAFFFGNAIITTETVSPKEIIRNKCGIILHEITSKCLSSELEQLLKNPKQQEIYSENSFWFSNKLNWDYILNEIDQKIKQINLNRKAVKRSNFFIEFFIIIYMGSVIFFEWFKKESK